MLLALLALVAASPAQAADVRRGDYVTIAPNETIDDNLYAIANTISMEGTVKGDVIAVGNDITVNGSVDGSVFAVGRSITINGIINGSVRISGQVMKLGERARISRDVAAVGYALEQQAGSSVGRDVLAFGYQALMAGSVGRDIKGALSGLELQGRVVRDVNVQVGDTGNVDAWAWAAAPMASVSVVQPGLTLGETGRVAGKLIYESGTPGKINPRQVGETVERRERTNEVGLGSRSAGAALMGWVQSFAMLLLVGLLLLWQAPYWTEKLAANIEARPVASLGWGALALLAFGLLVFGIVALVVILAILFGILTLDMLAAFVVGLGLAGEVVLIAGFLFFVSFVVQALFGLVIGRRLLGQIRPDWASRRVLALVVGLILFVIVTAIPVLGWLVSLVTLLLGLGAFWLWLPTARDHVVAVASAPPVPPAPPAPTAPVPSSS